MKKTIALIVLLWSSTAHAATISVWWDPNKEADIKGYRVYICPTNPCVKASAVMKADILHPQTAVQITVDASGFVAATAYDTTGNESGLSNTLPFTIIPQVDTTPPAAPSNLNVYVN